VFETPHGLDALERALRSADGVLRAVARATVDATRVACAPDELALETRFLLLAREGEAARTIRAGFAAAPPDMGYYVIAEPSDLGGAPWRLRTADLAAVLDAGEQGASLSSFLDGSILAAHERLHRTWRKR
jgi:hypothetical protein